VLDEVGLFDEQFFMYAEDIDLCLRVIESGRRVRYWPTIDVIHVGGGSGIEGRRRPDANEAFFRTMAPLYGKHRPGPRGAATAQMIRITAEALLLASRLGLRGPASHTSDHPANTGS
jgi:GT2 family glycosyltransferase